MILISANLITGLFRAPFEDLPDTYVCPVWGALGDQFEKTE